MEREDIIKNINYMKEVVESSNQYTNLSGVAGTLCGIVALIGSGLTAYSIGAIEIHKALPPIDNFFYSGIIWLVVFGLAVIVQVFFTIRKAKKMEILPWTKLSRQIMFVLIPILLAGVMLTIYLIKTGTILIIPPVWILLYGVGVSSAGMFSVLAVRLLGWSFIVTSIFPLFICPEYGLIFMALAFGVYHIIYGLVIYVKYKG